MSPHQQEMKLTCCNDRDYCNEDISRFPQSVINMYNEPEETSFLSQQSLIWIILVSSFILMAISLILFILFRRKKQKQEKLIKKLTESDDMIEKGNCHFMPTPCKPLLDNSDFKYFSAYNQCNNNLGLSKPPLNFANRIHNSSSLTTSDSGSSTLPYKYSTLNSNSSHTNGTNFTINHYNHYGQNFSSTASNTTSSMGSEITQQTTLSSQKPNNSLQTLEEHSVTSGSGSGHTYLVLKTLAKEIQLNECIGNGRYGNVWKGTRKGDNVAVKIFFSRDELSWNREIEIYQTVIMRHDNILGFLGADMISQNGCTELWLVTEYCSMGSLYDFLSRQAITSVKQLVSLMDSIIAGLSYLHQEILATRGKAAIAHRDIKSKNILMKSDFQCCIADFGLAVIKTKASHINVSQNQIVGTRRYLAPEVLNETLKSDLFESYRTADIYSLALVFWELFNRLNLNGLGNDYHVPYYNLVPSDPSQEEMRQLVCVQQARPPFDQPFLSMVDAPEKTMLESIRKLIAECWSPNPSARPPSLYIKKSFMDLKFKLNGQF